MSTDNSALNIALRQQLRNAAEQSKQEPSWAKRQLPAIAASIEKANSKTKDR